MKNKGSIVRVIPPEAIHKWNTFNDKLIPYLYLDGK
jgi:hypothetical protein